MVRVVLRGVDGRALRRGLVLALVLGLVSPQVTAAQQADPVAGEEPVPGFEVVVDDDANRPVPVEAELPAPPVLALPERPEPDEIMADYQLEPAKDALVESASATLPMDVTAQRRGVGESAVSVEFIAVSDEQVADARADAVPAVVPVTVASSAPASTDAPVDAPAVAGSSVPVSVPVAAPSTSVPTTTAPVEAGEVAALVAVLPEARVDLVDEATARAASLSGPWRKGTSARFTIDSSSFRDAYGADWAGRLQVVAFDPCVLTGFEREKCASPQALESWTNDTEAGTITFEVDLGEVASGLAGRSPVMPFGRGMLMAGGAGDTGFGLSGAAYSATGSYATTGLNPTGSWSVGRQAGSFNHSYPIDVPAPPAGPSPSVALSYDSQRIEPQPGLGIVRTNLFIAEGQVGEPLATSDGNGRGFSPAAGCAQSKACIVVNFEEGWIQGEISPTCHDGARTDAYRLGAGNTFDVNISASDDAGLVVDMLIDALNPRAPKLLPGPAIDVRLRMGVETVSRPGNPSLHVDSIAERVFFVEAEGDGYPSLESYIVTSSVTSAVIQDREGPEVRVFGPLPLWPLYPDRVVRYERTL